MLSVALIPRKSVFWYRFHPPTPFQEIIVSLSRTDVSGKKREMEQIHMMRCLSTESLVADLSVKLWYTNQPYSEVFSLVKLYSN